MNWVGCVGRIESEKWRNCDKLSPSGRAGNPQRPSKQGQCFALLLSVGRKSWHRQRSSSETWGGSSPPHHPFSTVNTTVWSILGNSSSFVPEVSCNSFIISPLPFACAVLLTYLYSYHVHTQHIREKVFKYEPILFAVVLMYGAFFWFGSKANYTKANTWFVTPSQSTTRLEAPLV